MDPYRLREAGFAIHWLNPRSKAPRIKGWPSAPVLSAEKLRKTYRDGFNVGVRLGEPSELSPGLWLLVLDLDIRENAEEAWTALHNLFPDVDFEGFPTVQSGSGGESRHIYFVSDKPFRSRKLARSVGFDLIHDPDKGREVKRRHWEIELFGTGKQVAMPPSIHPCGQPYRWLVEPDLEDYDLGLFPMIGASRLEVVAPLRTAQDDEGEELPRHGLTVEQAREALVSLPEEWVEDRDTWIRVGMALQAEFGDGGHDLWDEWSQNGSTYDPDELEKQWRSFRPRAGGVTMGSILRESGYLPEIDDRDEFDDLEPEEDEQPVERPKKKRKPEDRLNDRHAVAMVAGKAVVLTDDGDDVVYSSRQDLATFYANERETRIGEDDKKVTKPISEWWIMSKQRRQYRGVEFDPSKPPGGERDAPYNLWRGWSVEPDPTKSCDRFLNHLLSVICNGDEVLYNWTIKWLAHMVQRPQEKPGTSLILIGAKGTGKDLMANYVGRLFPQHHVTVANQKHVTGNFNAHLAKALLLHVEESFWSGNREADSMLKHNITAEQIMVEPKGVDPFHVRSCFRVIMTSNERRVVPASEGERRYVVYKVSGRYARDEKWFDPIWQEMEEGGPAALLHMLRGVDLTHFNVRRPPLTEGLLEQQKEALRGVAWWWNSLIEDGRLPGDFEDGEEWERGPIIVSKEEMFDACTRALEEVRYKGAPATMNPFMKELKRFCPEINTEARVGSGPRQMKLPARGRCAELFLEWLERG